MRVAVDLPERGGMDEVDVPADKFGEGGLGICPGKLAEQFGIGRHVQVIAPGRLKTAQKIRFDMAGRLRQSISELTARFPPVDLRKIWLAPAATIPF
jgi:hypothetical protein